MSKVRVSLQLLFDDYILAVESERSMVVGGGLWAYGIADNGAELPETVRPRCRMHRTAPESPSRPELFYRYRYLSVNPKTKGLAADCSVQEFRSELFLGHPDVLRTFDSTEPFDVRCAPWYENRGVHSEGLADYLDTEDTSA
jgi:hypothetical protein